MAISGKKIMPFLGVSMATLVAVLLVAATEGAVTVYNPVRIPVELLVDGESLKVESDMVSMDIAEAEQMMNITTLTGDTVSIIVKDGQVIIVYPETVVGNAPAVRVVPVPVDFYPAGEPLGQP